MSKFSAMIFAAMTTLAGVAGCATLPNDPSLDTTEIQNVIETYENFANVTLNEIANRPRRNPYFHREVGETSGRVNQWLTEAGLNPANFRYGRFCGAGWPRNLDPTGVEGETSDERQARLRANVRKLRDKGAPIDRIDELCFAHDYCYEAIGRDRDACDFPLMVSLLSTAALFEQAALNAQNSEELSAHALNQACANLVWDMTIAFLLKPRTGGQSDLVGHYVRAYSLYRLLEGDAGEPLVQAKLANQGTYGYPGSSDTCLLPQDERLAPGSPYPHDVFSKFANVAPFQQVVDRYEAGREEESAIPMSLQELREFRQRMTTQVIVQLLKRVGPNEDNQREFEICQLSQDSDPAACDEADATMLSSDWSWVNRRIQLETGAYVAIMIGRNNPELLQRASSVVGRN